MGEFGETRPPTCLLCNGYFDRKPAINISASVSASAHEGQGPHHLQQDQDTQLEEFKRGFKLVCKLLNVLISRGSEQLLREGDNFDEDDEGCGGEGRGFGDPIRIGGHPCCSSCSMGLLDLLRLEKMIEEAKARQQEVLEALKVAIVDNQDSHPVQLEKVWKPLRAELIQGINSNMDLLLFDDSCDPNFVLPDMEQPDPLSLEKELQVEGISPQSMDEDEPFDSDPLREPEPPPAKRSRGRPRKQTFSTSQTEINEDDKPQTLTSTSSSNSLCSPSKSKTKPCSIPLTRIKVEDYNMTSVSVEVKKMGRGRPRKEKFLDCAPSKVPGDSCDKKDDGVHCKNVFYLITEDMVLFQNTPIRFHPSGFTCLDCSHFVEGFDYFTFQNMRAHVNECHLGAYSGRNIFQRCPLCPQTFSDGKALRNHILGEHTPHRISSRCTVICESCWKPMPYYCFMYHTWFHKNDEEKAIVLSRGGKIARNVKLQLGIKDLVRRPHGQGEGVHFRNVFYLIADQILLFQNTAVGFKPNRFKCFELGCNYSVPGSDYFSFENMRVHINECHGEEYDRITDSRSCPICREEFPDGKSIRNHFIGKHTPHKVGTRCTVICESCWKPMPYYCLAYHVWFHKSEEEKQAALDGGEPISTKVKVMLGLVEKKERRGISPKKKKPNKNKLVMLSSEEDEEEWADDKSGLDSDPEFFPESSYNSREDFVASEPVVQPQSVVIPEMLEIIKSTNKKKEKKLKKKLKRKGTNSKVTRSKHGQGPGVNFKSVFYQITKEIILSQNTPIRSEPSGFTCLEPECSHFVPGSDYFTFQNMKAHVNECHGLEYERKNILRSCPLCPKNFPDGKKFRKHIVAEHTPSGIPTRCTVVCESCWKPMPYHCYLRHTWSHKSQEERKRAIEDGERIAGNLKVSLGIVDKNRPHNMPSKFRDGNFFFDLGNNYLYHKGIIIQFSAEEFICREGGCDARIRGSSDYDTFAKFREHVESCHNLILKLEPELESDSDENDEEVDLPSKRTCPICNLSVLGMSSFKRHIFWEHSPLAVCTSCWKPIKTYLGMGKHIWLHMNEDERAAIQSDPQLDKNDFYPIQKKTYYCQSCPMQFANTTNLRSHEKTHIPKHLRPKHKCDLCPFEGLYRVSLRAHIESKHKPELAKKKLECRICGRQFGHRHGHKLRIHMRGHTGETPFVCELCGKGFISKETLRTHSNSVHITTRPFQCEFCEKSYKLDYVLRLHQRKVHKELVPPANPQFQQDSVNIKYREMIGPKIAFPCDHCGRVFPFKSRLKYHVKTSHPEMEMVS